MTVKKLHNEIVNESTHSNKIIGTLANASTRLCSSEMTLDSSVTRVCRREMVNSIAASAHIYATGQLSHQQ